VLSHFQVQPLLEARAAGAGTAQTSADLNLSRVEVQVTAAGVHFPTGELVAWPALEQIAGSANACFELIDGQPYDIRVFSETTGWVRSLYPTAGAPSTLVSGMVMHRVAGVDPIQDTLNKLQAVTPIRGTVLDTCTGLGYTAIEAARTAEHVLTVELDPAAIEIARRNPWSHALFEDPHITLQVADIWDVVDDTADGSFSVVIHDPPTFQFAGELYSGEFYAGLHRVLRPRGRLFHYIGDPDSRSVQSITRGVIRRLEDAGFHRVARKPRAFGVVAYK